MKKKVLSESEVSYVAKLAHLGLTNKEISKFSNQLSQIINFVDQLNEVDTKNVIPTSQVSGLTNVVREDIVTKSFTQEEALFNAPDSYNGYFRVKAVFDK